MGSFHSNIFYFTLHTFPKAFKNKNSIQNSFITHNQVQKYNLHDLHIQFRWWHKISWFPKNSACDNRIKRASGKAVH